MPIKNLQNNQSAHFPIIGKLRKGGPKQKKTTTDQKTGQPKEVEIYGKDLDYFRFDSSDPAALKAFTKAYGEQPKQIRVLLPFATPEQNFQAWMEEYSTGELRRRCDSETQVFNRDKSGKSGQPKPCERLCGGSCACKQVGRLYVLIPELARLAYVIVETHSLYDIIELTQNLQAAHAVRGSLNGVPFLLSRRPRMISTPGDDSKRVRRVKNLLFLEPDPEWVQRKLLAMRNEAFALLPAQSNAGDESMYTFDSDHGDIIESDDEYEDGDDNPFDGTVRQSPAIDRLVGCIDKLFGEDSALATGWLIGGWCKTNKTETRSKVVELSDDECDSIADSLTQRGEGIKAKWIEDKAKIVAK